MTEGYAHERYLGSGWDDIAPNMGGGATAFFTKTTDRRYHVGVAVCSPKDQFSKRRGRNIAKQRALDVGSETPIVTIRVPVLLPHDHRQRRMVLDTIEKAMFQIGLAYEYELR